ncbi:MAG: AAA domain (dynein-related subfamily), partial [Armatimonadetes bacterium OLB18]
GKLFILNEINLAKPGNLAFLFSILADVNQSFDYYNAATGKTERRKIHENFRMIGTQNPEGPGRKDLNAALKNRAIEIDAPAYQDIELVALLRSKHPEFQTEAGKGVPLTLVRFYQDMAMKMASRSIGGEGEGYVWNLRHLMRLAEGFKKLGDNPPASQILQIIYDRVGVSLLPSDREVFFDAVRNYEYRGTKISAADVEAFKSSQAQTNLSAVYKEFGIDPVEAEKLAQQHGIVELATSARFLRSILLSLQAGYHPWLKGPAGTGKTKLASFASELLGAKVYVDTLTPQTDESQLKGELKPTVIILQDGTEKLGFKQVPSALVHALQDKSKLVTCILDEAAFAKPDVLEELNSLLDRDGGIWIIDDHGQAEFLARPEGFRLILASNTYGYSGVSLQSDALRSRTQEIFMGFEFSAEELAAMLLRFSSPGQGRLTTGGAPLGQTRLPLMHSQGFGAWRKSGYRLNTFDNPVRDKLRQGGHQGQIPEATIRLLEERYAELKNRLLGAAASMGRTGEITLEFDLGTATASMTLESPRVFHIGPDFLLTRGIEEMLTVAQHEGGHADISRIGSGYFFSSEKNRALLNVVEDLRVNARAMERAPGRSGEYLRFLKSYYAKSYEEIPQARIPELLPHEAFLQAAMARIYGGQTPWEKDPRVSQALTEALPHIQEAMELRPKDDNPEETKVLEILRDSRKS